MAASFSVDTREVKALARRFEAQAPEIVRQETKDGLMRAGQTILRQAQANITPRTGALAKSGQVILALGGRAQEVAVRFIAPYARWVEEGRGPVVARQAKALRFTIDGQLFFRRSVGPAKPVRYLARAVETTRGAVQRELDQIGARIARRIAAGR